MICEDARLQALAAVVRELRREAARLKIEQGKQGQ